jgi:hypothetical protein
VSSHYRTRTISACPTVQEEAKTTRRGVASSKNVTHEIVPDKKEKAIIATKSTTKEVSPWQKAILFDWLISFSIFIPLKA